MDSSGMAAPRYFDAARKTPPSRPVDAHDELLASLTRINAYNPPVQTCSTGWNFHGLYYGPTSIALLFFRLSQLYPDQEFKGQSLADWARAYLDLGGHAHGHARARTPAVDANHCGIGNETLAHLSIRAAMERDASLARQLCAYARVIGDAAGSSEWLYGRSGYLYLLRLARSGFESGSPTWQLMEATMEQCVSDILAQQPWTWHSQLYLGAAHGTFGILCQLVLSSGSATTLHAVEDLLAQLLATQLPSGNFPSSLPAGRDRLVQFCHGGPGAVLALRSLRPHFPPLRRPIDAAIASAQDDVTKRGLLTKPPCLCHGIAGNALAVAGRDDAALDDFLSYMSTDALEAHQWLREAGKDDEFVGLFTGEAGRAWVWAVADTQREPTCIGFNDL